MRNAEMFGTDPKGSRIKDYCIHCYQKGDFTYDITMDEMMRLNTSFAGKNHTKYYIAEMKLFFPHLKRWTKKVDTRNEHYKSILRVINYIKHNLNKKTDLKTLSEVACISPYYFHRIFKIVMGESQAEYTNRLRMEYVAEKLKTTNLSLMELAVKTGYSSAQALSRTFRKYFDLPPTVFKTIYFKETFQEELNPRIYRVNSKNIITSRDTSDIRSSWKKLYMYAMMNHLLSKDTESLEIIKNGSFYPALTTKEEVQTNRYVESLVLPESIYAIFTHKGDYSGLRSLFSAIRNYWLPESKYQKGPGECYIVYLNNPDIVEPQNLLTEIYIPLINR